jgi:hypothetical protein
MKLLFKAKDGGQESTVTGFWLIECKSLFSIVLLKFEGASRDAYHTHAFHSLSWLLKGCLVERFLYPKGAVNIHFPSIKPIVTKRDDFHQVSSSGTSWVLSIRGRWLASWLEFTEKERTYRLESGRVRSLG